MRPPVTHPLESRAARRAPRALVLLVLAVLAPLLSACAAVAAAGFVGAGVVQYTRNEARQDFAVDLESAWQATLEGLRVLEIIPESSELTRMEGTIRGERLLVRVERHPEGFTRVRVRVGTFFSADHRRRAGVLLQEIATAIESQDELRAWVEKTEPEPRPNSKQP